MRLLYASLLGVGLVGGVCFGAAPAGDAPISPPATREATLAILGRLEAPSQSQGETGSSKDPFNPPASDLTDQVDKNARGSDSISEKERLELIAAKINPTGAVELGGEPYLLFTEKRQKIGDKVAVSIDGVEYEVEIVTIEKSRFRIRYNNLETTRSIK